MKIIFIICILFLSSCCEDPIVKYMGTIKDFHVLSVPWNADPAAVVILENGEKLSVRGRTVWGIRSGLRVSCITNNSNCYHPHCFIE